MGYIGPMKKDAKMVVKEIVSLVGKPRAERLLIANEISPSMAGKLIRGTYKYEVGTLFAAAIERARLAAGDLSQVS